MAKLSEVMSELKMACEANNGKAQVSASVLGIHVPVAPVTDQNRTAWQAWEFEAAAFFKRYGFEFLSVDAQAGIIDVALDPKVKDSRELRAGGCRKAG